MLIFPCCWPELGRLSHGLVSSGACQVIQVSPPATPKFPLSNKSTKARLVAVLLPVGLETKHQELVQLQVVRGGVGLELAPELGRHSEIERSEARFLLFGGQRQRCASACRRPARRFL